MEIRLADLAEILQLRHDVLIVGTDRTSVAFDGDDDSATIHIGAFDGERCVGCVSLMRSPFDDRPAYQLRGMAVDEAHRGNGVGAQLLAFAESQVDLPLLWCNAREHAVGFYQQHGWETVGEPFEIAGVCTHLRMVRRR
jgi:predicted GNAT family N-acyltransferase